MKLRWTTFLCGLVLAGLIGYVAGAINSSSAAHVYRPANHSGSAAIARTPESPESEPSEVTFAEQSDGTVVYFPQFPQATGEAVQAEGVVEFAGANAPARPAEPAELPDADAAPLSAIADERLREIINHELADVPDADREIWLDALEGLPPEDALGILRLWRKFGDFPSATLSAMPSLDLPSVATPAPGLNSPPFSPLPAPAEVASGTDSAAAALHQAQYILAHNLLNAETIGFRRREIVWGEADGSKFIASVNDRLDLRQGRLIETGNPLDVAIDGAGFFTVTNGERENFTRCGRFSRDPQGRLVLRTAGANLTVQPEVLIPADAVRVSIAHDGRIEAHSREDGTVVDCGRIQLALFADPVQLASAGDSLFTATEASGPPLMTTPGEEASGSLRAMRLERSNVSPRRERERMEQVASWLDLLEAMTTR